MSNTIILVSDTDSSSAAEVSDPEYEAEVSDINDESGDEQEQRNGEVLLKNEGWADSLSKILGSSKPKNKKTLVLSRAKKHSEVIKKVNEKKPSFEVVGEKVEEVKIEIKKIDPTDEPATKKKVGYKLQSIKYHVIY